jgi:hypothetical protein
MPTLADIRARLRRMLEDTDPVTPLWSDTELNEWLAIAAREYGARFPREATATIAAVSGQTDYALPVDARRVLWVETPTGCPIPRRAPRTAHEAGAAQSWAHFGDKISLGYPPAAPLFIAYRGLYPFPASDSATFDLPEEGLDLTIAGAVLLALEQRAIAAAKRRGGSPDATLALTAARQRYADALRRCRSARADVLG